MSIEIELLKALFGAAKRARSEPGDDAPHEDKSCDCNGCRLARYELPLPAQDEVLQRILVAEIEALMHFCEGMSQGADEMLNDFVVKPLSPDAERALVQFSCDRIAAGHAAIDRLVALLPPHQRPNIDHKARLVSVDKALQALAKGRVDTEAKFAAKRREIEAAGMAAESVKSASAQETA